MAETQTPIETSNNVDEGAELLGLAPTADKDDSGAFFDVRRSGISNLGVYYPFDKNVVDIVGGHNLTLTGGAFTAL